MLFGFHRGPLRRSLLLLILFTAPGTAFATDMPFGRVDVGAFTALSRGDSALRASWHEGPGFGLVAGTPVERGELRLLLQVAEYEDRAAVPGFRSVLLLLGWRMQVELPAALRLSGGPSFGNTLMIFDGEEMAWGARIESELTAGLELALRRRLGGVWQANVEIGALHVFTSTPLRFLQFRFGLERRFSASEAWREFWR